MDECPIEDVDGEATPRTVEARDRYVVCREPLAEVVQSFVRRWNRDHEPDSGRFDGKRRKQVTQVRAVEWLSTESGISEKALVNMFRRTPEGRMRYSTIDLGVADALVSAIGCPEVFYTERMQPRLRSEASCCSGSLTGTIHTPPAISF